MLPLFSRGIVTHGFGRGSKQLGIPTANLPDSVVDNLPPSVQNGVYFGWASVRPQNGKKQPKNDILQGDRATPRINGSPPVDVYASVASIGWNPYYQNTKRSFEVHILHEFQEDFYGAEMRVCLTGYIRDERKFSSTEELIVAIQRDIEFAKKQLEETCYKRLSSHDFFVTAKPSKTLFVECISPPVETNTNQSRPHEVSCDYLDCPRHDD